MVRMQTRRVCHAPVKLFPEFLSVVFLLGLLGGCTGGTGKSLGSIDSQIGLDRVGYVYVARDADFLTEKTQMDVMLNGGPLGSLTPDEYAIGRAHGTLNTLEIRASGFGASFYPPETYRFSRRGRNNHYFMVGFEHRLTHDLIVLRQVSRSEWIEHVGFDPDA